MSDKNIKIIGVATSESTHPGFKILMENSAEVNAVLGSIKRKELIINAALNEVVVPYLRNGGKMTDLGSGFLSFSGELIDIANWDLLKEKLNVSYSAFADEIVMTAKPMYYDWKKDFLNYTICVNNYVLNYGKVIPNQKLITYANPLLHQQSSTENIKSAISWVNLALRGEDLENPLFKFYKSALTYKSGDKTGGILELESAISIVESRGEAGLKVYTNYLHKMKAGEKIW